ncbi:MAG TPA: ATP-binding protein [Planctomycetaceae bacterium]|nr:ATP-binding protein [Planctomycetaceae bacterium]
MTLTTRLSVFVLAMLSVVLVGFSLTLYLLTGRYLHRQTEERLDAVSSTLAAAVEITPRGLEWEPAQRQINVDASTVGVPIVWIVEDHQGRVLDRSTDSQTSEFIKVHSPTSPDGLRSADTVEWRSGPWQLRQRRILAQKDSWEKWKASTVKGAQWQRYPELVITVGTLLEPTRAALAQLAITLTGLSVGILLVGLFAARIACRRVLVPINRMAVAAARIDANDLLRRLPAVSTNDELEKLNRAFNGLLDRLQESFERQRRFTGEASHQLRTPLAVILGQIEVALRRERPIEEYQRVLSTVHKRGNHLNKIVESLLFLSRANADACLTGLEDLCVNSWLPQQVETWSDHERAEDIVLQCDAAKAFVVRVQPALLAELLHILVDNACKYSAAGTPIEIRVDGADNAVTIQVTDRGCGITEVDLPHLFTPFFRSEETRRRGVEGAGLGLSIARRLAHLFGGELTVRSEPGRGTCLTLRLPAATSSESGASCMAAAEA